ncbi:MAG: serine/threonine protein kinase [Candidatus Eremiobacteraeota bacterium]|nr:serine/threonine protein kinase [Candidatus Eremiobacteraeota bacterium]
MNVGAAKGRQSLPPGTELKDGTYIVGPVLGAGGFSITYSGKEKRLGTPVAIKEFFPKGCTRDQGVIIPGGKWNAANFMDTREAFLEEGKTMERFERPGIVKVYAAFEAHGTAYIVMEYLQGKTFSTLIQERGLVPEALAMKFISQLARTLDGIHLAGLLHGDIKPDNIMLTEDQRVILLDFGAARSYLSVKEEEETVFLTPGYAPPEQYQRDYPIDPATDVYAVAATLYNLLGGKRPPAAPARLKGETLPALNSLNSSVSARTAKAIRHGLSLHPERRPPTIRAFLGELIGPSEADLVLASQVFTQIQPRQVAVLEGHEGWVIALDFHHEGNLLASGDKEGKVWLWSLDRGEALGVLDLGSSITGLEISPDGKLIAVGTMAGGLVLIDLATGHTVATLKKDPPPVQCLCFTTDGTRLVPGFTDGTINVYEPPGRIVNTLTGHQSPVNDVKCSPGGRLMASVSNDKTARLWDLKSGRAVRVFAGHTRVVQACAFSPDGRVLATGASDFTIRLWDVRKGEELRKLKGHEAMVWNVMFTPDRSYLLSSAGDKTVRVWRLDSAREVARMEGHTSWVRALDYAPSRNLVASGGGDGQIRLWEVDWS